MKLIISVVVYKTPTIELEQAFKFIPDGLEEVGYEVHILDNANDGKLKSWCKKNHYGYHYLGRNVGFGKGHNEIFKRAYQKNTTYLFLNPDIEIKGSAIKKALAFLKKNPRVGLLSPKLLNTDGSIQLACRFIPSPFTIIKRFVFKSAADAFPLSAYKDNFLAPFIHGACFFVRGDFFKSLGGFDERYFMYMEDLDLCRMIQSKKLSVMLFNEVTAIHHHQKGSAKHFKLFLRC
jgi:GT2 family glycosyltransferase